MCGIAGILQTADTSRSEELDVIEQMTSCLRHRGPDAGACWRDRSAGVALGHRRLAIVDLTDAGRQPMHSSTGRFVVTFNGEIYNFLSLRRELEELGQRFRGGSDTEVLLAMIERWGLEEALKRSNGMFALGVWDREAGVMHLARDRMGKKPLYIARAPRSVVFASELKAIGTFPGFSRQVSPTAIAEFLSRGWLPDGHCIWRDAFKLPPGSMLSLSASEVAACPGVEDLRAKVRTWWSTVDVAKHGRTELLTLDDRELILHLDALLRRAVGDRMVADVPVGLFLSGGIDSSTVAALMQAQSTRPIRTFTIGFNEPAFDEAASAAAIARHLGTDHTELRVTAAAAKDVVPELPRVWDEPFADESQIPTLLLSRLARRDVTVALSGDGGDECFAGYARHLAAIRLAPLLKASPPARRVAAAGTRFLARCLRNEVTEGLPLPARLQKAISGGRLDRLATLLGGGGGARAIYRQLTQHTAEPFVLGEIAVQPDDPAPLTDLLSDLILQDMTGYLPGDLLVKLDRASMAASLEARCPILDQHVVAFSWRLPNHAKLRNGKGKWILRKVLERYVPHDLFERPKQGFDVPIADWLRGPLREWAEDLLQDSLIRQQQLLDVQAVRTCWLEFLGGRTDRWRALWPLLMFQSWLQASAHPEPSLPAAIFEPAQ